MWDWSTNEHKDTICHFCCEIDQQINAQIPFVTFAVRTINQLMHRYRLSLLLWDSDVEPEPDLFPFWLDLDLEFDLQKSVCYHSQYNWKDQCHTHI